MADRPGVDASAATLRALIVEAAERAGLYALHAAELAAIGDDTGVARAMKMLATTAVRGAEILPDLQEAVRQERALREAARVARESR